MKNKILIKKQKAYTLPEMLVSGVIIAMGMIVSTYALTSFNKTTNRGLEQGKLADELRILSQRLDKEIRLGGGVISTISISDLGGTINAGDNVLILKIPVVNPGAPGDANVVNTPSGAIYSDFNNSSNPNDFNDIMVLEYDFNNGWACNQTSSNFKCNVADYVNAGTPDNSVKTANLLFSYIPANTANIPQINNSNGRSKIIRQKLANNILSSDSPDALTNPATTGLPAPNKNKPFTYLDTSGTVVSASSSNIASVSIRLPVRTVLDINTRLRDITDIKVRLRNFG